MHLRIITFILLLPATAAQAQTAQREPGTHWLQAAARSISLPATAGSVFAQAQTPASFLIQVNDSGKTFPWPGSLAEMKKAFQLARDSRVVPWRADFPRRPSWLYPDDGCFARAAVAADTLKRAGLPIPGKIFAFGNLSARTPRNPSGQVNWWYHVAVAYRHAADIYVFDPAVEESQPLKMQDWMDKIGGAKAEIKISLCDTKAYNPDDDCQAGSPLTTTSAFREQLQYLDLEWDRLLELGENPQALLGEKPIWEKR